MRLAYAPLSTKKTKHKYGKRAFAPNLQTMNQNIPILKLFSKILLFLKFDFNKIELQVEFDISNVEFYAYFST